MILKMTSKDDTDRMRVPVKDRRVDARRRRAAKLLNERLKLMATFFNGIGIATSVAMIIVPLVNADPSRLDLLTVLGGLFFAFVLHILAQAVLTFWKSEE